MTTLLKPLGARLLTGAAVATAFLALAAGPARAAAPAWRFTSSMTPTNVVPGAAATGLGPFIILYASNVGTAGTTSAPMYTDVLPAGLTFSPNPNGSSSCSAVGQVVTCQGNGSVVSAGGLDVVLIPVDAGPLPEGTVLTNHASVSGGGAPSAKSTLDITISSDLAPFALTSGQGGIGGSVTAADGLPATQAGSHPSSLTVDLGFSSVPGPHNNNGAGGGVRDIGAVLPRGLIVNPEATPVRCTEAELESGDIREGCPDASVVGTVTVITSFSGVNVVPAALYNMVPPPGVPAELGFDAIGAGIYVHIRGGVRAGDYSLTADSHDILARQGDPILGIRVALWGDPSSPVHDGVRGDLCVRQAGSSTCPVIAQKTAFLTMPTACSDSLLFEARATSWLHPGDFVDRAGPLVDGNEEPTGVSGCSDLDFRPGIDLQPTTRGADSSSGMNAELSLPQDTSLDGRAEANLKKATIVLPAGVALNPSAADGLGACGEAQIGLASESPIQFNGADPTCPDASKVGSGSIDTPLLPDPVDVDLYVADPSDNPFHTLLSGYLVAHGQGILIKLAGRFDRDPVTGQITATFDDNPQVPFSDLHLHFKGGDRGILVTPSTCGTYTTSSSFSSWSAADPDNPTPDETRNIASTFTVDHAPDGGPCVAGDPNQAGNPLDRNSLPFAPTFSAGTVSPQAGGYSPFVVKVSKPDGSKDLKKVAVTLPLGLTAKLAGVPRCPQSAIIPGVGGSTSCSADSQVGTVTVGAGAGSTPFFLADQPVYLTDGYDGAPFGLVIDTHAVAGPFDLGHVVVRTKLSIDPITAQVSADAETLPSIIQGIPLHVRSVTLRMDRSTFVLNPTNCAAQTVAGQITGGGASFADPGDDTVKGVSSAFQVGGCASLGLAPKLAIGLTGKGQTTDDKHPGVHATVSQAAGQANLKKVVVSLPLSLALDPDNANGLCEFADGSKVDPTCPKGSIVGKAVARTPILDQPLTGPVYFVKNIRKDARTGREIRTLPKLVIPLTGENGLRLNLVGTSNVVNNRLVTTFDNIPDAPVSDFTLDIIGGKGGILVVSGTDICKATQVADQQIDGQNGKTADASVYLQTPACALKIISKKVGKSTVAVKVGGLGAGKVTVTGHGIKKTSKTIAKSTVATITAKRTKGKPGKVTVSFDPTGPAKAHKTSK